MRVAVAVDTDNVRSYMRRKTTRLNFTHAFNDFVVFQAKLALDGVKDLLLINLSVVAIVIDMISGGGRRPRRFYAVVRLGQRFDRMEDSCDGKVGPPPRPIPSIALSVAGISPGKQGYEPSAAISGARLRIGSVSRKESDSPQEIAP